MTHRVPKSGLRSHGRHQHHGPYAPGLPERHETPDLVRSNAVQAQFHEVRHQLQLTRHTGAGGSEVTGLLCRARATPRGHIWLSGTEPEDGRGRRPYGQRTWRDSRYTQPGTGCSAAWLARRVWVAEVAGSNPASPTTASPTTAARQTDRVRQRADAARPSRAARQASPAGRERRRQGNADRQRRAGHLRPRRRGPPGPHHLGQPPGHDHGSQGPKRPHGRGAAHRCPPHTAYFGPNGPR
jgi:hypothetical protein